MGRDNRQIALGTTAATWYLRLGRFGLNRSHTVQVQDRHLSPGESRSVDKTLGHSVWHTPYLVTSESDVRWDHVIDACAPISIAFQRLALASGPSSRLTRAFPSLTPRQPVAAHDIAPESVSVPPRPKPS